jgi:hypothetical protein
MTQRIGLKTKFKNGPDASLPLSYYEEVVDINKGPSGLLLVTCVIKDDPEVSMEYKYTFVLDLEQTPFSIQECCTSLMGSNYEGLLKKLEDHIDKGRWSKDGEPLPAPLLATRLRQFLNFFHNEKSKMQIAQRCMQPQHLSRETSGIAGSQQSR